MRKKFGVSLLYDEGGQGLVEYSLVIFLIAIGLSAIIGLMGFSIRDFFLDTSAKINGF